MILPEYTSTARPGNGTGVKNHECTTTYGVWRQS